MKRFVIFLPILLIGTFKAADNLVGTIPLSSIQLNHQTNVQKSDLLLFESNNFYDQTRSEITKGFLNFARNNVVDFKFAPDDWKQITANRTSLFPCISLQESSSKKDNLDALKKDAFVLFKHDGSTHTKYEYSYNSKSPLFNKINSVTVSIEANGEVKLNTIVPNGTIKDSKEKFLPDFSGQGRKIKSLYFDPTHCHVWLGLQNGGIYCYKVLSNQHESFSDKLQEQDIKALGFAGNDRLLVSVTKNQILFTDIQNKISRMRILFDEDWTKAYLTNTHVILSKKWYRRTYNTYYTLPINYGLGVGFASPNEIAYLWFLNQLKKGLTIDLAYEIQKNDSNENMNIENASVVKASLFLTQFLAKTENVRPFDRAVSRVFKAFLKEQELALTSKK